MAQAVMIQSLRRRRRASGYFPRRRRYRLGETPRCPHNARGRTRRGRWRSRAFARRGFDSGACSAPGRRFSRRWREVERCAASRAGGRASRTSSSLRGARRRACAPPGGLSVVVIGGRAGADGAAAPRGAARVALVTSPSTPSAGCPAILHGRPRQGHPRARDRRPRRSHGRRRRPRRRSDQKKEKGLNASKGPAVRGSLQMDRKLYNQPFLALLWASPGVGSERRRRSLIVGGGPHIRKE